MDRVIQKTDDRRQSNSGEEVSEIGHSNRPDQSNDQIDIASVPGKSVDVTDFSCSPGRHSDEVTRQIIAPMILPPIIGDSKNVTPQKWESLSASERVAFLQRWMMYAELKYRSPVADWPEAFAAEWLVMKDSPLAAQYLIAAGHKLAAGKSVLNYVARVMEGYLPEDVEQWRVLYIQAYHIAGIINRACTRLQCMIDTALVASSLSR